MSIFRKHQGFPSLHRGDDLAIWRCAVTWGSLGSRDLPGVENSHRFSGFCGSGKRQKTWVLMGKPICKWWILHCDLWLPEGGEKKLDWRRCFWAVKLPQTARLMGRGGACLHRRDDQGTQGTCTKSWDTLHTSMSRYCRLTKHDKTMPAQLKNHENAYFIIHIILHTSIYWWFWVSHLPSTWFCWDRRLLTCGMCSSALPDSRNPSDTCPVGRGAGGPTLLSADLSAEIHRTPKNGCWNQKGKRWKATRWPYGIWVCLTCLKIW